MMERNKNRSMGGFKYRPGVRRNAKMTGAGAKIECGEGTIEGNCLAGSIISRSKIGKSISGQRRWRWIKHLSEEEIRTSGNTWKAFAIEIGGATDYIFLLNYIF